MTERDDDALRDARDAAERFDFRRARRDLARWFDANARSFPWRDAPSPYRVLVSEFMLQQTTTQTVERYFPRFLERFPTARALADASDSDVLKLWEGLGYYRRARMLRDAARTIVEKYDGRAPEELQALEALPGVGRYVAGAVRSFGFDKRAPILEANTRRLHARLLALRAEISSAAALNVLWAFADAWLPRERAGRPEGAYRRLNAALMDLGRLVCAPNAPKCDECPLASLCRAKRLELQSVVPVEKPRRATIPRQDVAFWIRRADLPTARVPSDSTRETRDDDVLLVRRPDDALWAGMWDFPRFERLDARVGDAQRRDPALRDRLKMFLEDEVRVDARDVAPGVAVATLKHAVTHFRIELTLRKLAFDDDELDRAGERALFDLEPRDSDATRRDFPRKIAQELRWVGVDALKDQPLSSTGRKLATIVAERSAQN